MTKKSFLCQLYEMWSFCNYKCRNNYFISVRFQFALDLFMAPQTTWQNINLSSTLKNVIWLLNLHGYMYIYFILGILTKKAQWILSALYKWHDLELQYIGKLWSKVDNVTLSLAYCQPSKPVTGWPIKIPLSICL